MTDEPALTPEPAAPAEETYRVIGATRVFDTDPGKTFTRTLTPSEERLVGTHIEKVGEADQDVGADVRGAFSNAVKTTPPAAPSGPTKDKE